MAENSEGFIVGDIVEVVADGNYHQVNGYGRTRRISEGDELRVTRIYTDGLIIRHPEWQMSFQVRSSQVRLVTGADGRDPGQRPRRLGTPPEDEGTVLPTDPGIQWLWEDLGKHATNQSWCAVYDEICERFGIPGRERNFAAEITVNGVRISATMRARSKVEANQKLREAINQPTASVQ